MTLLKERLATALRPCISATDGLDRRWRQFWSYARLNAQLSDVPSSVIVLGMPELHGSRRILLGRNLYLYRDLYLETREKGVIRIGDDVVLSRGVHLVAYSGIEIGDGSMNGEYSSFPS